MLAVQRPVARSRAFSAITLLAAIVAGCSQRVDPIGPGHVYQPDDDERELWSHSREAVAEMTAKGAIYADDALRSYIEGVARRVLARPESDFAPLAFRIHILEDDSLNAAAFPTGDIVIHTAMLGRIRNEAQLALLLGHEIAHATHRHAYQRFEKEEDKQVTLMIIRAAAGAAGGLISTGVSAASGIAAGAIMAGYGRDLEREADEVGLARVEQAGYDPAAAIALWSQMLEVKGDSKGLYMYASHPRMSERLESCRQWVSSRPPPASGPARDVGAERYARAARALIERELAEHDKAGREDLAGKTREYLKQTLAQPTPAPGAQHRR